MNYRAEMDPKAYGNAMKAAYDYRVADDAARARDPRQDFLDRYNSGWQMSGGGGGYDRRDEVRDQYNTMRNSATTGRDETRTRLEDLYAQLAQSYAGQADQTKQRYNDAIGASQAGSNQLINETRARIDQEAAQRNAMYAQMGISGGDPFSQSRAQAERGIGDIGNTSANWSGLLGAQQQAQMTRDNQSYLGAKDQGTISLDDMQRRYDAYNRQLDAQEQQALMGAYQPGSGGGMVNTSGISDDLYNQVMMQGLQDEGVLRQSDQDWFSRQEYMMQYPEYYFQTGNSGSGGNTVPYSLNPGQRTSSPAPGASGGRGQSTGASGGRGQMPSWTL
jgi:hypothetical protein